MSTDKSDLHDVWEHDGESMRKFNINDQVVPTADPLTNESASWGPRTMNEGKQRLFDETDVFLVANSVEKKIFGSRYWFHELSGWVKGDDGEWKTSGYFGHFNAADLRAPTELEEVDLHD